MEKSHTNRMTRLLADLESSHIAVGSDLLNHVDSASQEDILRRGATDTGMSDNYLVPNNNFLSGSREERAGGIQKHWSLAEINRKGGEDQDNTNITRKAETPYGHLAAKKLFNQEGKMEAGSSTGMNESSLFNVSIHKPFHLNPLRPSPSARNNILIGRRNPEAATQDADNWREATQTTTALTGSKPVERVRINQLFDEIQPTPGRSSHPEQSRHHHTSGNPHTMSPYHTEQQFPCMYVCMYLL